jgi:hypothetical protein
MRSLNLFLAFVLAGALMTGCDFFEQRDRTYTDDPKLEFFPLSETIDEGATDGNTDTTITTAVQLIGPQRDSDLSVNFSVVDTIEIGDEAEYAEEGVHYSLPSTSTTIPANASSGEVEITVLDNDQADAGQNYVLFLTLEESNGVEPAENLKTYTLTIRGTDE